MVADEAMSHIDNMQEDGLDAAPSAVEGRMPMTRTTLLITLAAAAALAGCNKESHTIVAGSGADDNTANTAANAPVALPPSITSSKAYRCTDNKLVYIDWMSDGSARVKKTREEVGTAVTPGNELKGDPKASSITYNGQSCKA
jgi:hypothetical protein